MAPTVIVRWYKSMILYFSCGKTMSYGIMKSIRQGREGSTDCVAIPFSGKSAATLLLLTRRHCLPGTTIISDRWGGYNALALDGNFDSSGVNQSLNFAKPDDN